MKPQSIKLFDRFYLTAIGLNVVAAVIGWKSLAEQAGADLGKTGEEASGMANWLVASSIFLFALIALVLWSAISQFRVGLARWPIAAAIIYGASDIIQAMRHGSLGPVTIVNAAAIIAATISIAALFRADARSWLAASPDHPEPFQ